MSMLGRNWNFLAGLDFLNGSSVITVFHKPRRISENTREIKRWLLRCSFLQYSQFSNCFQDNCASWCCLFCLLSDHDKLLRKLYDYDETETERVLTVLFPLTLLFSVLSSFFVSRITCPHFKIFYQKFLQRITIK